MQSLFVFWHQRGPRKWIGVWTNWHHPHERSGKKFSNIEVVSSFSSSPASFRLSLITILIFTIRTVTVDTVEYIFYSTAHSLLKQIIMLVLSSLKAYIIKFSSVRLEESWAKEGITEYHIEWCIGCIRYPGPTSSSPNIQEFLGFVLLPALKPNKGSLWEVFSIGGHCGSKRVNKQTSHIQTSRNWCLAGKMAAKGCSFRKSGKKNHPLNHIIIIYKMDKDERRRWLGQ